MAGPLDDACAEVVARVDGAVACGVVDLRSGRLLGVHHAPRSADLLTAEVAAAIAKLFRGHTLGRLDELLHGAAAGGDGHRAGAPRPFHETHVTAEHGHHFAKAISGGKAVIMMVTKKTTNIGLGWAQLKASIPAIEPRVSSVPDPAG